MPRSLFRAPRPQLRWGEWILALGPGDLGESDMYGIHPFRFLDRLEDFAQGRALGLPDGLEAVGHGLQVHGQIENELG